MPERAASPRSPVKAPKHRPLLLVVVRGGPRVRSDRVLRRREPARRPQRVLGQVLVVGSPLDERERDGGDEEGDRHLGRREEATEAQLEPRLEQAERRRDGAEGARRGRPGRGGQGRRPRARLHARRQPRPPRRQAGQHIRLARPAARHHVGDRLAVRVVEPGEPLEPQLVAPAAPRVREVLHRVSDAAGCRRAAAAQRRLLVPLAAVVYVDAGSEEVRPGCST